tara:strand:+ start:1697 stop:2170 length:474 start_codon:yes stop_codon:yes gene_type:complete
MPNEIERKFLVKYIPENLLGCKIKQGYLQTEKHRTVRIRTTETKKNHKGYITIKGASNDSGLSRYEFETKIPINEAIYMLKLCNTPLIEKTRYIYKAKIITWEIDEFHGMNSGLVVAEVELSSEKQKIKLPDFIYKEVTGIKKYYNNQLQKNPYKSW